MNFFLKEKKKNIKFVDHDLLNIAFISALSAYDILYVQIEESIVFRETNCFWNYVAKNEKGTFLLIFFS